MKKTTPRSRDWRTGRPAPTIVNGTPLQLLIQARMQEIGERDQGAPLSYQQVAERSDGNFSRPLVGLLLRGESRHPTPQTITGLAIALEVDEATIREAIRQGEANSDWELPARVQKLAPDGWDELLRFADYLLQQQKDAQRKRG